MATTELVPIVINIGQYMPQAPADLEAAKEEHISGGDYGSHVVSRRSRSILPELKSYQLSDEIKIQADTIYNKMTRNTYRGRKRLQLFYYCSYCAYLELRRECDPNALAKVFGLTTTEVKKTDSLFSQLQTGYRPPKNNWSVLDRLAAICSSEQLGLDPHVTQCILVSATAILAKEASLSRGSQQTLAAGLLHYFLQVHGVQLDNSKLVAITERSMSTIEEIVKHISLADNR